MIFGKWKTKTKYLTTPIMERFIIVQTMKNHQKRLSLGKDEFSV
ncbi:11588_t:CDS:2, partial [Racocetra persica]